MNENFIELLTWIILYELSSIRSNNEHKQIFKKLYERISDEYQLPKNNWDMIMDEKFDSHIELGNKMRNFYYSHFAESNNGQESTLKFIEQLQNGRYHNEFHEFNIIGNGSFGEVWRVKNKHDHQEYAIKRVKYNEHLSKSFAERILREIRLWPKLIQSHYFVHYVTSWAEKNTQQYNIRKNDYDVNAESWSENQPPYDRAHDDPYEEFEAKDDTKQSPMIGRILYIQMELCRMTLKDAIAKINSELNQKIGEPITVVGAFIATQFFHEIASAVNYLHSQSPPIIHRDLKPGNIFLTDGRDGNFIKIGDFGVAVMHGSEDNASLDDVNIKLNIKHTQKQGTLEYMAPEVKESSQYNEKCDIYSLGCIGMDLLCVNKELVNDRDLMTRSLINSTENVPYKTNLLWKIQECLLPHASRRPTSNAIIYKDDWLVTIEDISKWPLITNLYDIILKENALNKIDMNPLSDYIVIMKLIENKEKEISKHPWVNNDREKMISSMELCKKSYQIFLGSYMDISCLNKDAKDIEEMVKQLYSVYASPESIAKFVIKHLEASSQGWDSCIVSVVNSLSIKIIVWKPLKYFYTVFPWDKCRYSLLMFHNHINDEMWEQSSIHRNKHSVITIINQFDDEITQLLIDMAHDTIYDNIKEFNQLLKAIIGDENAFAYMDRESQSFLVYENVYRVKDDHGNLIYITVKCKFAAIIDDIYFAVLTYEESDYNGEIIYKFKNHEDSDEVNCISQLNINGLGLPPPSLLSTPKISFF